MAHHHSHQHTPANYNRAFALGVLLNIGFVIVEFSYGMAADSLALIADAGHNLSDVFSLLLAWGAAVIAGKAVSDQKTYGYRKATILAALVSALVLLVALAGIAWEAIERFTNPQPIEGLTMIIVAAIGVVINTLTAILFLKGQKEDLNIRGAFLHMAADAAVSLGVVVAGLLILWGNWLWLDPAISLVIVAVVFLSTWGLLRDSLNYAMDGVPRHIHTDEVRQYLLSLPQVISAHDLHIWPLSTTTIALSVHLEMDSDKINNQLLSDIQHHCHEHFGIAHATIQVESTLSENHCALNSQPQDDHAHHE
jgi:cobalt-zinc-cadmium efflux system protein